MTLHVITVHVLILISFSFISVASASSQPLIERSDEVTLSSLTDKVVMRNPANQYHNVITQQVTANNTFASATFANTATLHVNYLTDQIAQNNGATEWEAAVELPLWLPGQKKQQHDFSERLNAEIPAHQAQLRLDSSGKVRTLIWDIVLAEMLCQQAMDSWLAAQKLEEDVNAKVKAGELARTEKLLANSHTIEQHNAYVAAQAELTHSMNTYRLITGERYLPSNVDETMAIQGGVQSHDINVPSNHPKLMVWEQRINTLRSQQQLAKFDSAVNPTLTLGMKSERGADNDNYESSIGIGFSVPLNNKTYRKPAVMKASRELADAEIMRKELEKQLHHTLLSLHHDIETKQHQLTLVKQQAASTRDYFTMQKRAFELGEASLAAVLKSQTLSNQSNNQLQVLELKIKRLIAEFNQAMGLIL